jgi:hypothetical protein
MMKLHEIPKASAECNEDPEVATSRKGLLISRLESQGLSPIAICRAVVVIERTETRDEALPECRNAETLKISIYSDPDVSSTDEPECLYLECGRYGLASAHLQVFAPDGRQRIFAMDHRQVRDEA